jgi:single-stranded-DNA-specific exonuclease
VRELSLLEPFGKSNEKPQFAQKALRIKRVYTIGKEGRFLKIIFENENGYTIEGMEFNRDKFVNMIKEWFNEEECVKMLRSQETNIYLDVVYYPEINEYAGHTKLQIKPISYRKSN